MLALQERRRLRDRYESLDPFTLKDELETKLKQILKNQNQRRDLDMTTLQRLFTFSAAGGRELRLKARPPARFMLAFEHPKTYPHYRTET